MALFGDWRAFDRGTRASRPRTKGQQVKRAQGTAVQVVVIFAKRDVQNFMQQQILFFFYGCRAQLPIPWVKLSVISASEHHALGPDIPIGVVVTEYKCIGLHL